MNLLLGLTAAATVAVPLIEISAAPPARIKPADIHAERELLITHPAVVDSEFAKYPGPWSFGTLLEHLVGEEQAPVAARDWLEQFYLITNADSTNRGPGLDDPAMRWIALRNPAVAGAMVAAYTGAQSIPSRAAIWSKVVQPWQTRDGFDPSKGQPWMPNLANAPFRLLAIVNRMDIAATSIAETRAKVRNTWNAQGLAAEFDRLTEVISSSPSYFGSNNFTQTSPRPPVDPAAVGEGRLVFGAMGPDGQALAGGWTLIFEYPLTRETAPTTVAGSSPAPWVETPSTTLGRWAFAWHRLGEFDFDDPRYNEALAQLTRAFTNRQLPGTGAAPGNERARFNQLRTSEAAFGADRVFRQFELTKDKFVPASLPMTPAVDYMGHRPDRARLLSRLLITTQPFITAGLHALPRDVSDGNVTRPLLASHAVIPAGEKTFHWDPLPPATRDTRRIFSMNTCNGCHAADTSCPDGLHIHPRNEGEAAKLSAFLRVDGRPNRFQDPGQKSLWVHQQEMSDRAQFLAAYLDPRESHRIETLDRLLKDRLRRGH